MKKKQKQIKCLQCGKSRFCYLSTIRQGGGKFCSYKCSSIYRIGKKGVIHSIETKEKMRLAKLGKHFPKISESKKGKNHYRWKGGNPKCLDCGIQLTHFRVKRCKSCFSKTLRGSNNHFWKGGITPLHIKIRNSFRYDKWRSSIYERDKYTCVWCGYSKGSLLNADHIKSFSSILKENNIKTFEEALECEELWNLDNGRTLCHPCHTKTDNYGMKEYYKLHLSS